MSLSIGLHFILSFACNLLTTVGLPVESETKLNSEREIDYGVHDCGELRNGRKKRKK